MNTNQSLVATVREQIDQKYREAIEALEKISSFLIEGAAAAQSLAGAQVVSATKKTPTAVSRATRVERVLATIAEKHKLIGDIARELNEDPTDVRSVLYAKTVANRVHKKKIDGKVAFKAKAAVATQSPEASHGEKKTVATLVRELLVRNQDGLHAGDIRRSLADELRKNGVNPRSVGTALYNLLQAGDLVRSDGIYRLTSKAGITS